MTHNIKTVSGRSRIPARRDPYWERLEGTLHLGWRKMAAGGDAHWIARMLDGSGKRIFKALGVLEDHPDGERWNVAKREAEAWAQHISNGGSNVPKTVAECCRAFVDQLKTESGKADTLKRFERHVFDDPQFAGMPLDKLKKQQVTAWLDRLKAKPVMRGSGRGDKPTVVTDKARSDATINRDVAVLSAALNFALKKDWVTSDRAWSAPLTPISNAEKRRDVYLDRDQRQRLIEAAGGGAVSNFLRALCMLPIRPGALAALTVSNYDARRKLLSIRLDKTGARDMPLPDQAAAFFAEQCRGKLPGAYIFPRDDGRPMDKDFWKGPIKAAVLEAGLPGSVTAYSLRHATITDLIATGIPSLTVAQISGTSVAMIEKHYGQLIPSAATAALATLAL